MARKKKEPNELILVVDTDNGYPLLDNAGRLHCEDGPALRLIPEGCKDPSKLIYTRYNLTTLDGSEGFEIFFHHGIPIPPPEEAKKHKYHKDLIDRFYAGKDKLTAEYIDAIPNMELRRVAMEKLSINKYMEQSKFKVIHTDVDNLGQVRKLVKKELPDGEVIMGVFVTNSTPNGRYEFEQKKLKLISEFGTVNDQLRILAKYRNTGLIKTIKGKQYLEQTIESGKFIPDLDKKGNLQYKTYFIQVHPELRPMWDSGKVDRDGDPIMELGEPQELTCHNAVASTFSMYGDEYEVDVES